MDAVQRPPPIRLAGEFEAFHRDEYTAVVAVVRVSSGSRCAAEDIVQEALLRAYRDWVRVGHMGSPQAWVRRVAINPSYFRSRRLRSEASVRASIPRLRAVGGLPPAARAHSSAMCMTEAADGVPWWVFRPFVPPATDG